MEEEDEYIPGQTVVDEDPVLVKEAEIDPHKELLDAQLDEARILSQVAAKPLDMVSSLFISFFLSSIIDNCVRRYLTTTYFGTPIRIR
jgi:hypothetical protein